MKNLFHYSVLKVSEGGEGYSNFLLYQSTGATVHKTPSAYIGHVGYQFSGTKVQLKKVCRLLGCS